MQVAWLQPSISKFLCRRLLRKKPSSIDGEKTISRREGTNGFQTRGVLMSSHNVATGIKGSLFDGAPTSN